MICRSVAFIRVFVFIILLLLYGSSPYNFTVVLSPVLAFFPPLDKPEHVDEKLMIVRLKTNRF